MLDPSDFRAFSEEYMPDSFECWRKPATGIPDGEGGFIREPVVAYTTKGRYATASYREVRLGDTTGNAVEAIITVPFGTDVRETDVFRWVEKDRRYSVSGIMENTPELSPHLEVLVRRA